MRLVTIATIMLVATLAAADKSHRTHQQVSHDGRDEQLPEVTFTFDDYEEQHRPHQDFHYDQETRQFEDYDGGFFSGNVQLPRPSGLDSVALQDPPPTGGFEPDPPVGGPPPFPLPDLTAPSSLAKEILHGPSFSTQEHSSLSINTEDYDTAPEAPAAAPESAESIKPRHRTSPEEQSQREGPPNRPIRRPVKSRRPSRPARPVRPFRPRPDHREAEDTRPFRGHVRVSTVKRSLRVTVPALPTQTTQKAPESRIARNLPTSQSFQKRRANIGVHSRPGMPGNYQERPSERAKRRPQRPKRRPAKGSYRRRRPKMRKRPQKRPKKMKRPRKPKKQPSRPKKRPSTPKKRPQRTKKRPSRTKKRPQNSKKRPSKGKKRPQYGAKRPRRPLKMARGQRKGPLGSARQEVYNNAISRQPRGARLVRFTFMTPQT